MIKRTTPPTEIFMNQLRTNREVGRTISAVGVSTVQIQSPLPAFWQFAAIVIKTV
jgi:hypothetical protein